MFSFFKTKPKEQWRLVKTFSVDITLSGNDGKLYYHLFESNRHSRRIDIAATLAIPAYMNLDESAKRFNLYQEKIYRWEMGRVDPDIPTYDQVPEEETVNVLRGKIN